MAALWLTERMEYLGVCPEGHRSYLRLVGISSADTQGVCSRCGQPADLVPLPPPDIRRVAAALTEPRQ
jgi:hypothetical protein